MRGRPPLSDRGRAVRRREQRERRRLRRRLPVRALWERHRRPRGGVRRREYDAVRWLYGVAGGLLRGRPPLSDRGRAVRRREQRERRRLRRRLPVRAVWERHPRTRGGVSRREYDAVRWLYGVPVRLLRGRPPLSDRGRAVRRREQRERRRLRRRLPVRAVWERHPRPRGGVRRRESDAVRSLSLHDALPIWGRPPLSDRGRAVRRREQRERRRLRRRLPVRAVW